MNLSKSIEFLLDQGCPSIIYRTRKEILGESVSSPIMLELQEKIQTDSEVKRIFESQKEKGWLGGGFHGEDGPECGIRYLIEKGVESNHPIVQKALEAIIQEGEEFQGLGAVGKHLDDYHVGGFQMMKACVFAYAGCENEYFVQDQIVEALSAFKYVNTLTRIDDVYNMYKNKIYVFGKGVKWPSIYHLRLLAYTHSWKNAENLDILNKAFTKLAEFSPIPNMKLLHKNQAISPASLYMNDFKADLSQIKAKEWMMWFHRTEMIARLGINTLPMQRQIQFMRKILSENDGLFIKTLSHYYFNKWTQYVGLALEENWRTKNARISDLTFRSLLILKLTNQLEL